jgi:ABC-type multidrug transport system fused ATPase/permease subunit
LLSQPKILILDEATANLDYNTEAEVKHAIHALRGTCTIIIIAHRYSMVRDADQVYVLGDGKVIEHGTPDALIRQGGWFAEFANAVEEDDDDVAEKEAEEESDSNAEPYDESGCVPE